MPGAKGLSDVKIESCVMAHEVIPRVFYTFADTATA